MKPFFCAVLFLATSCGQSGFCAEPPVPKPQRLPPRFISEEDTLPKGATLRIGSPRLRHPGTLHDGWLLENSRKTLSLASPTLWLWDIANGRLIWKADIGSDSFGPFDVSRDETTFVAVIRSTPHLYDLGTGRLQGKLLGVDGNIKSAKFSPDSKLLALGGWEDVFELRDVGSGKRLVRTQGRKNGYLSTLLWFRDGTKLLAFSPAISRKPADNELKIIDARTGEQTVLVRGLHCTDPYRIALSPAEDLLAFPRGDTISLLDLKTLKERTLGRHDRNVHDLLFTPDGKSLISTGWDETTRFWDVASGKEQRRINSFSRRLTLSSDCRLLVGTGVVLWDTQTGERLLQPRESPGGYRLVFSPDSKVLVTAGDALHFWERSTGKLLASIDLGARNAGFRDLAFSPDGALLAGVDHDETVRAWEVATGKEKYRFQGKRNAGFLRVGFTADGRNLAAAGEFECRVWELTTGKARKFADPLGGPFARFGQSCWSGQGMCFLTYEFDPDERVGYRLFRDALSGEERWRTTRPEGTISWTLLSPDRWMIAECGRPHTILDPVTGTPWHTVHAGGFGSFSADSRYYAAPSHTSPDKHLVVVWDCLTWKKVIELPTEDGPIAALTFSPDGQTLATGMNVGTVLFWDLSKLPRDLDGLKREKLTKERFDALWTDLAWWRDASVLTPMWELYAAGNTAVAPLKTKLRPAPAPDVKHIQRLVADLAHVDQRKREAAREELETNSAAWEPVLREVLRDGVPAKTRDELNALLHEPWFDRGLDLIRRLRAIQVLGRLNSRGAREVLEEVASGWPQARETQLARLVLLGYR